MGPKTLLLVLVLGCLFSENFGKSLPRKNFADIIKGLPDKFEESNQSRALGWPAAATPRGLLPFYMIAEYIIDAYSGGGLKGKLEALQKSCSVRALGVLIIPVLLAIVAAIALIVLQVVNIILTALVLATNFGVALTGKKLGLPKFGNVTADLEPEQCNSQLLRLIRHDCEYQARDLTMVELGGKQYYFSHSSIKMPMEEASDFCRARCQQLVSVEDPAEETELFGHLTSLGEGEIEPFWTSGSYKNGKYRWLATGRDFGYIQLAPPRLHRSVDASCVGMASVRNETAWIGAPCVQANRFICEKPQQLAYKDHFLYEQMKAEEEAEAAAVAATASTPADSTETTTEQALPAVETNEIRRRWG